MGKPPDLQLPRPPAWPPWAIATSVALHLAVLAALALLFVPLRQQEGRHLLVSLAPQLRSAPRNVTMVPPPADTVFSSPSSSPQSVSPSLPLGDAERPVLDPARSGGISVDSIPAWIRPAAGDATRWPSLESGLLWDRRPLPQVGLRRTHAQLTDSAVKAIINHYLDSLAALPGGGAMLPPSWKATIGGQEFGLDGRFVTVAGVKVPSLLLLLIPLPVTGDESKALDKAGMMRADDYEMALPREAAAADQREQAKAIRARKAAEQELRRAQRAPPAREIAE